MHDRHFDAANQIIVQDVDNVVEENYRYLRYLYLSDTTFCTSQIHHSVHHKFISLTIKAENWWIHFYVIVEWYPRYLPSTVILRHKQGRVQVDLQTMVRRLIKIKGNYSQDNQDQTKLFKAMLTPTADDYCYRPTRAYLVGLYFKCRFHKQLYNKLY